MKPVLIALNDGSEQAQFVAQRVLELRDEGVELNENRGCSTARIITRWSCSSNFRVAESRIKLPAEFAFFEQAHIKDVASFIRFVANPRDEGRIQNAWCDYCPELGVRLPKICGMAGRKSLDSVPVAAVAERDPGPTAAADDRGYSIGEGLLKLSVSTRSKKMWGAACAKRWTRSLPTESRTRQAR